ncbi:glutathione S-transferase [Aliidiomarina sedimenti]|uniref:Glutathione S-transferase n=2 Tax=Aliidiomarina TaxID=1249554 RepID=A0A432WGX7_9GAMM|nr:glutathione S-transferase [Aliidiomarina sedimenti]RUO33013.1 glutathione S-transferase [Aliidiomarina soli]
MVNTLPLTSLFAALLTLLYIVLAIRIIRLRWKERVGLGTGESLPLKAAVRVHGNFAEYVPLGLILLALMELNNASEGLMFALGGLLFVARIFHAIGLTKSIGVSIYRTIGVLGTFAMLIISAGFLLGSVLASL